MEKNYTLYAVLVILFIGIVWFINFCTEAKRMNEENLAGLQKSCEQSALIFYKREIAASTTKYLAEARWDEHPFGCYLYLKGATTTMVFQIGSGGTFGELQP
jgi:hypothetical protein